MSKYKRKYQRGEKITSLSELMKQEFIYFVHKITHKGWFVSWQIRLAQSYIDRGMLYYAMPVLEDNCENETYDCDTCVHNGDCVEQGIDGRPIWEETQ